MSRMWVSTSQRGSQTMSCLPCSLPHVQPDKVCRSRARKPEATIPPDQPWMKTIWVKQTHLESTPTILARFSNPNGSADLHALPDSGADVSVTGIRILESLHEHKDNLLPSKITPRTMSGHQMTPLGKLPVTISVGNPLKWSYTSSPKSKGYYFRGRPARNCTPCPSVTLTQSLSTLYNSQQPWKVNSSILN